MISFHTGNLLDAQTEALVNTVNEVGVMGKGIALMFREAFPANTAAYEAACIEGEVRVGRSVRHREPRSQRPALDYQFPDQEALAATLQA